MRAVLDRPIAGQIRLEHLIYLTIAAGTLSLRLLQAGEQPLHHDEAIHAYAAWKILEHGVSDYVYDPVYHGPVLYYLGAVLQGLLGSSDLTARLPSILCGTGLVALAWPLRALIGRREALVFALLVALSPTIGYYSRSLRHDVPLAFFTLGAAVAFLHYVRSRQPWLAYTGGILLGLAAATKEDIYLTGVVFAGAVVVAAVLARNHPALRARASGIPPLLPLATAVLIAATVFLVFYTSLLTRPEQWNATARAVRYWWQQHEVQRIPGPWWYYLPYLAIYEPLVLGGAVVVLCGWLVSGEATPASAFVAGWAVLAAAAYAWAQEKVPWLMVPMLVPLALVAAHHFARLSPARLGLWAAPALLTVWSLVASNYLYGALRPEEPRDAYHFEPLAYVQTTYDIPGIVSRIDELERTAGPPSPSLVVSGQAVWPLSWYLRGRPVAWNHVPTEAAAAALVVDVVDAPNLERQLGDRYRQVRFAVRGWWVPDWQAATVGQLLRFLALRRPWNPPGTTDAVLFAAALAPGERPATVTLRAPPPALGYAVPAERIPQVRILGDGAGLRGPRGVAVAADGSVLVADTGNNRIVRLDAAGAVMDRWGGPEPGDGPGRFREPCGLAANDDGTVYVADTWNHRVQKLDASGRPIAEWRMGGGLWGPRAVAVAGDGRVFIADTGNKRVVVADPTGRELFAFGGDGDGPGKLVEPVGLAIDPSAGLVYVADTGNRRIQVFTLDGTARGQWRVPGWEQFYSEPYLAWDGGLLWSTDAFNQRLNGWDRDGHLRRSVEVPGQPRGVATTGNGTVLVSDGASRILAYGTGDLAKQGGG